MLARRSKLGLLFRAARYRVLGTIAVALCSMASAGQTLTATLPTGQEPFAVALDPATNKVYVVNRQDNTVNVINGATNAMSTVAVGSQNGAPGSCGIAVNPASGKVYVANSSDKTVTAIDEATLTTATISLPLRPICVAVDSTLDQIYVLTGESQVNESLVIINGSTNSTTAVDVGLVYGESAMGVDPVNHMVFIGDDDTDGDIGHVAMINGQSGAVVAITTVGIIPASGVVVNSISGLVYVGNNDGQVCCSGSSTISVLDATTGNLVGTINLGQCCFDSVRAVNPITNKIYALDNNGLEEIDGTDKTVRNISPLLGNQVGLNVTTNQLYFYQGTTLFVIDPVSGSTTTLSGLGTGGSSVAVNPLTGRAYLTDSTANTLTVVDGATNAPVRVPADLNPSAAAVNAVTGKAYIANAGGSTVTEIDGRNNNATLNIPVGTTPVAVGINQVTNSIYVANQGSNDVTVVDGGTHATSTVAVGANPSAVGVNSATSQIYVANKGGNSVTVIDGSSSATTTVNVGTSPVAVGVNPSNNKIYVVNQGSNNTSIIDGASNTVTTVATGNSPFAVALNSTTNNAYVANGDGNVIVVDGSNNVAATVPVGAGPVSVAVDTLTNKIYVANQADNSVTIIDGASNAATTLAAGSAPLALVVNPARNKVYVVNGDNNVVVIDGATFATSTVAAGSEPVALAVDPVANKVYVANANTDDTTVITEQKVQQVPLTTAFTPTSFAGVASPISDPVFNLAATSSYFPNTPEPQNMYFQVDGWQGPWTAATPVQGPGSNFTAQLPSLTLGDHIVYAFATDGQDATALAPSETVIGLISGYAFSVVSSGAAPQLIASVTPATQTVSAGQAATYSLTVSAQGTLPSAVTFACTGLPAGAACSFSPNSVNAGANPTLVTVTISTKAPATAMNLPTLPPHFNSLFALGLVLPGLVLYGPLWKGCRRVGCRPKHLALVPMALLLMLGLGCSNSAPAVTSQGGTPPGTYKITVTSTAGNLQTTNTMSLTVK